MLWNHILEKQPQDGEVIIQLDKPYEDFYKADFKRSYCMGMRRYEQHCSHEEHIAACEKHGWLKPDFWWISAKDFPFPPDRE